MDMIRTMFRGCETASGYGSDMSSHMPTLCLLAMMAKGPIVELGVGKGNSTLALLAGTTGSVFSYDIVDCKDAVQQRFRDLKALSGWSQRWCFGRIDSVRAASTWFDKEVGLWFLDTSHKLEATRQELATWLPKMSEQGIMCGHDYYLHHVYKEKWAQERGVEIAVNEFAKQHADRFDLQIFPQECGLFILWPKCI